MEYININQILYLEAQIVDTTGTQDDIGARRQDLLNTLFRDVRLSLADAVELLRVVDQHLDSQLHLGLHQREVEAGDLGICHLLHHHLRGDGAVERVAWNDDGFPYTLSVSLQYVNGLDGVEEASLSVTNFDRICGFDDHVAKEVAIAVIFFRHYFFVRYPNGNNDRITSMLNYSTLYCKFLYDLVCVSVRFD